MNHDPANDPRPAAPALLPPLLAEALVASLGPDDARALAASLLAQADAVTRAPRVPGLAPRRHHGRPVLARHLHDVACGWRVATRADDDPTVGWCTGCACGVALATSTEVS